MALLQTPSPPSDEQSLSAQEARELATITAEIEARGIAIGDIEELGPQTDDELWDAVYALTGYAIPRVAVCIEHGHVAPFEIFADVYFCRLFDVCMIGNRGGGKTTISGFLHGAKCRWNPRYKSTIVGATDRQAGRGYAEFKRFIRQLDQEIVDTLLSKTRFMNLSELEVLTGTMKQMNGPHPHFGQFDELELSTQQIFDEFQNMAQGDEFYPSQNLLSSTRKFVFGLIQQIVKRAEDDINEGNTPEWEIRIFCVFETMSEVPNCQHAPADEREARLTELGLDPCSLCECEKVTKGKWENGTDRTFADVCGGRGFRSRGFVLLNDVHRRFKRLSREVWEAQQECLRPDPAGLVHKWLQERHILPVWYPKPAYGAVYRSWDWGGTNPHSVHFHQVLDVPLTLKIDLGKLMHGEPNGVIFEKRLREGDIVTFDEVYYTGGSTRALARKVMERTAEWQTLGFKFKVLADIADPAGKTPKEDVRELCRDEGFPEPEFTSPSADRIESVKKHKEWGGDDRLLIVGRMCPWMLEEYAVYHYPQTPDNKALAEDPVKVDDHAMDETRLFIWYLYKQGVNSNIVKEVPTSTESPNRGSVKDVHKNSGMKSALGPQPADDSPIAAAGRYMHQNPAGGSTRKMPNRHR